MEKEFIPYEQALALKMLIFDEPCFGFYLANNKVNLFNDCKWEERTNSDFIHHFMDRDTSAVAPTYSQAFRWFRKKYGLQSYVKDECPNVEPYYDFVIDEKVYGIMVDTYEEADFERLKKLIELVKKKLGSVK